MVAMIGLVNGAGLILSSMLNALICGVPYFSTFLKPTPPDHMLYQKVFPSMKLYTFYLL